MKLRLSYHTALLVAIAVVLTLGWAQTQTMSAQDDVFHIVKGVVKHVDKDTKTMVVKAGDGTEHTIKWTDKTTVEGGKDIGDGIKEGSKVSVKYTEKAGEKTAVGVKDAGKATAKAVNN
ncbi:hypothetical protein H7849_17515 [Alloacidobacterium dinghuense]|uniref:DUF5666 domain-containing protein n=1 Tax=Alloacidobacterium dinghuense TaxID=2763107 RepID=A0A7G8BED1_9BACT|nr:hypothetical protein [Alloacidobacterium dinghuense]QNI30901.1 hypothetical protein H7849_17515 [Alloacidobacterium dinghuense]